MTDILEILENGRVDWSDEQQTTTTIVTKNERLAIAEIKKLRARIAELEAALKPFAVPEREIELWFGLDPEPFVPDDTECLCGITVRDLRAARAALAVAEPVIREQEDNALREENARLREVLKEVSVCLDGDRTGEDLLFAVRAAAAAIREGGK
jgi:hypothetical protein